MKKSITSKSTVISMSSPDYLFVEVREWQSELDFYKSEMVFLKNLLDKNFLSALRAKEIATISTLSEILKSASITTLPMLMKKVLSYETMLGNIAEGNPVKSRSKIENEHDQLKLKIFVFINEMRILKKKIFKIIEKKILEVKKVNADYMEGSLAL